MKVTDYLNGMIIYDSNGQTIWDVDKNGHMNMIADIRGWGHIQNMFSTIEEAAEFQDNIGGWIADAIREKLEREKGSANTEDPYLQTK